MWVTQTYLGCVEPDAKAFVYYFFENYVNEQAGFTDRVQRELEHLGEVFGDSVSLLMPNPRYAGRIEAEIRENRELWKNVHAQLPGLFISPVPLREINGASQCAFFVPFAGRSPVDVAQAIIEIRRDASDMIERYASQRPEVTRNLAGRMTDALELKPGFWGFRIDLRRLLGQ